MEVVKSKKTSKPRATKPVVKKAIKAVPPKVGRIQFNHLVVTTDYVGKDSSIIMSSSGDSDKSVIGEIQTVVAAGPNAGAYITSSGDTRSIQPGDKVMLDLGLLNAKRAGGGGVRVITFQYSKSTGMMFTSDTLPNADKEDIANYIMISDREILMINP